MTSGVVVEDGATSEKSPERAFEDSRIVGALVSRAFVDAAAQPEANAAAAASAKTLDANWERMSHPFAFASIRVKGRERFTATKRTRHVYIGATLRFRLWRECSDQL